MNVGENINRVTLRMWIGFCIRVRLLCRLVTTSRCSSRLWLAKNEGGVPLEKSRHPADSWDGDQNAKFMKVHRLWTMNDVASSRSLCPWATHVGWTLYCLHFLCPIWLVMSVNYKIKKSQHNCVTHWPKNCMNPLFHRFNKTIMHHPVGAAAACLYCRSAIWWWWRPTQYKSFPETPLMMIIAYSAIQSAKDPHVYVSDVHWVTVVVLADKEFVRTDSWT